MEKRPVMGKIAEDNADLVILTSDNPRSEDPEKILDQISRGMKKGGFLREVDRKKAISLALSSAKKDDIILVAGKGHETGQIIGDRVLPFDDVAVIQDLAGGLSGEGFRNDQ
jgi:UDP-N-acetylmuramyl tripeptide synthase